MTCNTEDWQCPIQGKQIIAVFKNVWSVEKGEILVQTEPNYYCAQNNRDVQ